MTSHVRLRRSPVRTIRCLIVDDDPSFQSIASYTLTRSSFATEVVDTGARALAQLASDERDVLLIDLRLPDMSGITLLAELRSRGITTPAVMASGAGSVTDAVDAMKTGASDFIEKPVPNARLVESLVAAFSNASPRLSHTRPASEAAEMMVGLLVPVIYGARDVPTVRDWAGTVCMSEPVIYGRCAAVSVGAKNALDLARILRVAILPIALRVRVSELFANRDLRSVGALLKRSGISLEDLTRLRHHAILDAQRCVESPSVLGALHRVMDSRIGNGAAQANMR